MPKARGITKEASDWALRQPDPLGAAVYIALVERLPVWRVAIRVMVGLGIAKYLATGDPAGCVLPEYHWVAGRLERCKCILCSE